MIGRPKLCSRVRKIVARLGSIRCIELSGAERSATRPMMAVPEPVLYKVVWQCRQERCRKTMIIVVASCEWWIGSGRWLGRSVVIQLRWWSKRHWGSLTWFSSSPGQCGHWHWHCHCHRHGYWAPGHLGSRHLRDALLDASDAGKKKTQPSNGNNNGGFFRWDNLQYRRRLYSDTLGILYTIAVMKDDYIG